MTLAILGLLATVNPAAATLSLARDLRTDRPVPVALGVLTTFVVLVGLAAGADTILDALGVNLGTYRLGAGVVVAVAGLRWMVAGPAAPAEEPASDLGLGVFVCFPALLTPGAAALAVSLGADESLATVALGAALATVLGGLGIYLRRSLHAGIADGLVRLLGGTATVIGILVAVDGIKTL